MVNSAFVIIYKVIEESYKNNVVRAKQIFYKLPELFLLFGNVILASGLIAFIVMVREKLYTFLQ
jgi:hypothetical protein